MADTEAPKIVESTVEEKKVEEKVKVVEATKEAAKVEEKGAAKVEENGDKVENGDSKEDKVENGNSKEEPKETTEEKPATEPTDKCCIKRKSTGDAVDGKPAEATPEKKAKITDSPLASATTEKVAAESNGDEVTEAEAAA